MSPVRKHLVLAVLVLAAALPGAAQAQSSAEPAEPVPQQEPTQSPEVEAEDPAQQPLPEQQEPAELPPAEPGDAPVPPPGADIRTEPQPPLVHREGAPQEETHAQQAAPPEAVDSRAMLDGKPRQGAFLAGPGSLTFILHHSLMGAAGGFFTQAFARDLNFDQASREAMLAGTFIGAGLGFGLSSWWQFNHWVDTPMANFGIVNSVIGGMFLGGFMDLLTTDKSMITWSAFVGTELGAWLTAMVGGGQMSLDDGLLVASGGAWGLAYSALLLAIVHFAGTDVSAKNWADTLLLAPGIGAGALALASMRYNPTSTQIIRADLFGAGVGAVLLAVSSLALGGFDNSTPYVLALLGSAGAITTVSLLWEESAERPKGNLQALNPYYRDPARHRPYRRVWW
ncbi:MAG TPA: hypothetical protein VFO83_07945 [Aggregicoccus sp.]|nr:hypothetical protein [Aggregicoccus sp.]